MKKILTTLILSLCLLTALAQNSLYRNAESLSTTYDANNADSIIKVCNTLRNDYKMTAQDIRDNPFLKFLGPEFTDVANISTISPPFSKFNQDVLKTKANDPKNKVEIVTLSEERDTKIATDGNLEAAAINAIANFMAERFKQEVVHMGVDNLFKYISDPSKVAFVRLFPNTYKHIQQLYQTHEYYAVDFAYIKQLVALDIGQMGKNVAYLFADRNGLVALLPNVGEKTADLMCMGGTVIKGIIENQPLNSIIDSIGNAGYLTPDIKESAQFLSTLNKALLKTDSTYINARVDINPDLVLTNGSKENFFCGLLYHKIVKNTQMPKTIAYIRTNVDSAKALFLEVIQIATELNNARKVLNGTNYSINNYDDLIKLTNNIATVYGGFSHIKILRDNIKINTTGIDKLINYTRVITEFYHAGKDDYKKAIVMLLAEISPYINDPKVTRTIMFVTQLLATTNANEIEDLLKTYALPIGSSSIKRNSPFNISLNGYVGATYGWQYDSPANFKNGSRSAIYGISAPIGLTFSFAPCNWGSWSIFASAIDLGPVVNQRIKNDTTYYSKLRFDQFIALGGGAFFNIKRTPLSIGATCTYHPKLTYFSFDSNSGDAVATRQIEALRVKISLLVDIPFFTIYNKSNMLKKNR